MSNKRKRVDEPKTRLPRKRSKISEPITEISELATAEGWESVMMEIWNNVAEHLLSQSAYEEHPRACLLAILHLCSCSKSFYRGGFAYQLLWKRFRVCEREAEYPNVTVYSGPICSLF